MSYYIPTVSRCLKSYPFLNKTFRKDYYKFKKIPETIYNSLPSKSQDLYREIKSKESSKISLSPVIWSLIGVTLSLIGLLGSIISTE